jgi:hypothetical protein
VFSILLNKSAEIVGPGFSVVGHFRTHQDSDGRFDSDE